MNIFISCLVVSLFLVFYQGTSAKGTSRVGVRSISSSRLPLHWNLNLNLNINVKRGIAKVISASILLGGCHHIGLTPTPCLAAQIAPKVKVGECVTDVNPISGSTVITCRKVGMVDGRLQGCQSTENCFSSSAKSASKYSSPWTYGYTSSDARDGVEVVTEKLKVALQSTGLKILKIDPISHYFLAAEQGSYASKQPAGSSLFYEFLIKDEEKLILYRGVVDKTVLLYPLQQPVTDFGALQGRLEEVRQKAGFLKGGAGD